MGAILRPLGPSGMGSNAAGRSVHGCRLDLGARARPRDARDLSPDTGLWDVGVKLLKGVWMIRDRTWTPSDHTGAPHQQSSSESAASGSA